MWRNGLSTFALTLSLVLAGSACGPSGGGGSGPSGFWPDSDAINFPDYGDGGETDAPDDSDGLSFDEGSDPSAPDAEPIDPGPADPGPDDPGAGDPGQPDPGRPDPGPADTVASPDAIGGGVLLSEVDSNLVNISAAAARFTDPQSLDPTGTPYGPCYVDFSDPDAERPLLFGYDAGQVSVTGTTPPVTFEPIDEGATGTGYDSGLSDDHTDLLPGGGASIGVSGAGGAHVPAFSLELNAPDPVELISPVGGFGTTFSTAVPLDVTWVTGNGEQMLVTISPLSMFLQPEAGNSILCVIEGDPGAVSVPAEALAQVRGNASSRNAAVTITRLRSVEEPAGSLKVLASATRSTLGVIALGP